MKKLTTPKEVFTYIRDKEGFLECEEFICLCIEELNYNFTINTELNKQCVMIMDKNKPKNDSFTKFKYWYGGHSWWCISSAKYDGNKGELLQEKRRFLTHLINKI
jgi:hypothetical protein